MKIPNEIKKKILDHAEQCKPQESCGFIVSEGKEMRYLRCENIADDPMNFFEIASEDLIEAEQKGEIIAFVHSHPDIEEEKGLPYLSTADRECQLRMQLDFWLVVGGEIKQFRNIAPLLGRQFENNKQDCRNILLDSYMLAGIDVPDDVKYEFNWFETSNLYEENLIRFGCEKLAHNETPQLGDIVMVQIGADVPNHAGIYLGNQLMLHHSEGRLSARVPYDGFWLDCTHSIWRYREWQKLNFTAILNDLQITKH
ncbi:NlpC/P60 family [Phocoenobacter uteri]|uniref:NlpC/P60 family n=1 Tax=Phocoenobacter uteri TaxID=146806 RepID=A0A379C989_9PAST|nr:C40 family peptidase [Phocoenobacter uteri]MDG6882783.1 phage tail protein [Phocoenobacter uteri]SUB58952.1 NlpC/P60 family [Phocoenobacter uteri]